jgi:hypothetical protein
MELEGSVTMEENYGHLKPANTGIYTTHNQEGSERSTELKHYIIDFYTSDDMTQVFTAGTEK